MLPACCAVSCCVRYLPWHAVLVSCCGGQVDSRWSRWAAGDVRVAAPRSKHCPTANHMRCAADEVAWLFNLRGGDVAYNPVFVSLLLWLCCAAGLQPCGCALTPIDAFQRQCGGSCVHPPGRMPAIQLGPLGNHPVPPQWCLLSV